MEDKSEGQAGRPRRWRPWTIWLPGGLVLLGAAGLIFVDLVGLVMGSWDTPAPGLHWLKAGIAGQCVLGAAGGGALAAGLTGPDRRRACAVCAWLIVAAEIAWFVLTARLASG
jgi:hypothetical protein